MIKFNSNNLYLVVFCLATSVAKASDKPYQAKLKERLSYNSQHLLDGFNLTEDQNISTKFLPFPKYYAEEVNEFLSSKMSQFNVSMHPLILEYIAFWTEQPMQDIRSWISVNQYYKQPVEEALGGFIFPDEIRYLSISMVSFLPQKQEENGRSGAWQLYAPITLAMGGTINEKEDQRQSVLLNTRYAGRYLQKLYVKYHDWTLATTAFVCGASALNKALLQNGNSKDYWDLYPFLPIETRDFYPAMMAAAFMMNDKNWKIVPYLLEPKFASKTIIASDTVYKEQILSVLNIDKAWFDFVNAEKTTPYYLIGEEILVPKDENYTQVQIASMYLWNKAVYFPVKADSFYVFYHTNRGDHFSDLTRWFGPSLEEIKRLNSLNTNSLTRNEDVFFRVAKKDSLLYAGFDAMTNAEKDKASGHEGEVRPTPTPSETKPSTPKPAESKPVIPSGAKVVYYTIKSGDTLWAIAQKYNTTDVKLQAWNQIGAKIQPGQKIKIYIE